MPLKILLADDSVPAQNMGKKILTEAGYEVVTAGNGLEALRKIGDTSPQLAILDIFMPGYTGLELCARLRKHQATAELPVILTVGRLEPYRAEEGEQVKANAVIVKPFAAAELLGAVRTVMGDLADVKKVEPTAAADPLSTAVTSSEQLNDPLTAAGAIPVMELTPAAAAEEDDPLAGQGPGVYGVMEEETAGMQAGGAESLLFNPDAKQTPFRASAVDLLESVEEAPLEQAAPAYGEFDLEAASAPLEAVSEAASEAMELERPTLEIAEMDPMLELSGTGTEASPFAVDETSPFASDEASPFETTEASPLETAEALPVMGLEPVELETAETVSSEIVLPEAEVVSSEAELAAAAEAGEFESEEARRLAFEELFNSSELPPLENRTATLPSIPLLPEEQGFAVLPDPELEVESESEARMEVSAAGLTQELEEQTQSLDTGGKIPERDSSLMIDQDEEPQIADWAAVTTPHREQDTPSGLTGTLDEAPLTGFGEGLQEESPLLEEATLLAESPLEMVDRPVESEAFEAEQVSEAPVEKAAEVEAPLETEAEQLTEEAVAEAPLAEAEEVVFAPLEVAAENTPLAVETPAPEEVETPVQVRTWMSLEAAPEEETTQVEATAEPEAMLPAEAVAVSEAAVSEAAISEKTAAEDVSPEESSEEEAADIRVSEALHAALSGRGPVMAALESKVVAADVAAEEKKLAEVDAADVERISQAVDRVFDRFKRLLVRAIVQELAKGE